MDCRKSDSLNNEPVETKQIPELPGSAEVYEEDLFDPFEGTESRPSTNTDFSTYADGSACSKCGCKLPGMYKLNALLYSSGDFMNEQIQLELPYSCFVCRKRICPNCGRDHSYGAFLVCSPECSKALSGIQGMWELMPLRVADDAITELDYDEARQTFYWSFQCSRCGRVHTDDACYRL